MFALAILIGIYSYSVFFLGLTGMIYPVSLLVLSLIIFLGAAVYYAKNKPTFPNISSFVKSKYMIVRLAFFFLVIQAVINIVGVFGPELAFDSLWYHLTLPKLYLEHHTVVFVPGHILHYSTMPKLVEMLYIPGLALGSDVYAKLIHFAFGILTLVVIYKIARTYLSVGASLIAAAIFYSNLVVGWESITSYVDLGWAFFQAMALWGFLLFIRTHSQKWLIESAVMTGLAITTKILAVGSLPILIIILVWVLLQRRTPIQEIARHIVIYFVVAVLIPLPWLMFSFIHTGNPFYPVFSPMLQTDMNVNLLRPDLLVKDFLMLFTRSADPISPIYILLLPFVIVSIKRFSKSGKIILFYSALSLIVWYFIPRSGGGRFILPYLPAFSLVAAEVFQVIVERKTHENILQKILLGALVVTLIISLAYRAVANSKYIPVIFGISSREEFLTKNLNFSFGDFYDTDKFFEKTIKDDDMVLLYGFHNLYYVDFPYVDASWVQKGQRFNYIAVQNGDIPERFRYWSPIYYNPITRVTVYTLRGQQWIY